MDDVATVRAFNDALRDSLKRMVGDLTDEQIGYSASAIDARPIAEVAQHAIGGIGMVLSLLGGAPVSRPAPQPAATSTQGLLARLDAIHDLAEGLLAGLTEETLRRTVRMPWGQEMSGRVAIAQFFAHGFLHAGAIAGMRAIGGFPTPPETH